MAHGENESMKANACGKDYWKPIGLIKSRLKGWMFSISCKAGANKKTKRFSNKAKRQEIKRLLRSRLEDI